MINWRWFGWWRSWISLVLLSLPLSAQLVPPITAECATSTDGSVVGVPNPLNPPVVAPGYTGTLPASNYYVQFTWYDAANNVTIPSPEVQVQLTATGNLTINAPTSGAPANAAGMQIYIGQSSGGESLQGMTSGMATYTQNVPLVSGVSVPSSNTTLCQIIANDAGIPTGTGYEVTLETPAGNTQPGYPQQWQLIGAGGTLNISNGFPFYNGTVTFPVPISAIPYGHGPQSISGPLSLGTFGLTAGTLNIAGLGTFQNINVTNGIQIAGSFGTAGYLLATTGSGTQFIPPPSTLMVFSCGSTVTGSTLWCGNAIQSSTSSAAVGIPLAKAVTLKNLACYGYQFTGDLQNVTATLYDGAVSTRINCTTGYTSGGQCKDTAHSFSASLQDVLALQVLVSGGGTSLANFTCTVQYQ